MASQRCALVVGIITASCAGPELARTVTSGAALTASNGKKLNGVLLNGKKLNGKKLNGVSLGGATLSGVTLGNVALEGTIFRGTARGRPLYGEDFVGSFFEGNLDDGTTVKLRIDAMAAGAGADADVNYYSVSYDDEGTWRPLCGDASLQAVPVLGRWNYGEGVPGGGAKVADPTSFTFGCQGAAIVKCIEAGYKPWRSEAVCAKTDCWNVSLDPYHQACTRLIRADYCGDGVAHTVDGRAVNLYDGLGIQTDSESWVVEAEWSPDGATCIDERRVKDGPNAPWCRNSLKSSTCGRMKTAGSLIVSEIADVYNVMSGSTQSLP